MDQCTAETHQSSIKYPPFSEPRIFATNIGSEAVNQTILAVFWVGKVSIPRGSGRVPYNQRLNNLKMPPWKAAKSITTQTITFFWGFLVSFQKVFFLKIYQRRNFQRENLSGFPLFEVIQPNQPNQPTNLPAHQPPPCSWDLNIWRERTAPPPCDLATNDVKQKNTSEQNMKLKMYTPEIYIQVYRYPKFSCLKGVTFSQPSFRVSTLIFRGVSWRFENILV